MQESQFLEESVLGGMLLRETNFPPSVMALQPEYFTSPKRAQIFDAIMDVYDKGLPVDEIAVNQCLEKWGEKSHAVLLSGLVFNTPTAENLDQWAMILLEAGQKKHMRQQVSNTLASIDSDLPADEVAAIIQETVKKTGENMKREGLTPVKEVIPHVLSELHQRHTNPDQCRIAATGIKSIDGVLELGPGQLTILAGRPSMGKSALIGNIVAYCSRDQTRGVVALFSLEMDKISLVKRMISADSGIGPYQLPEAAEKGKLVESCAHIHDLNLWINDKSQIGIAGVRNDLSRLGAVRLVAVDYLQLMSLESKDDRRDLQIGAITKGLKSIAKEFSCHVVVLSQLSRNVEKRKPPIPQLSDLRDSGNIEEDADNVLLLYRGNYYNDELSEHQADLFVAKQRHGITGRIGIRWDSKTQTFSDLV